MLNESITNPFHIVRDDEYAPSLPVETLNIPEPEIHAPLKGKQAYDNIILNADLNNYKTAFLVACTARSLLSSALDLRQSIARYSPEKFPRGTTPGEKSAEALESIVRAHISETFTGKARADDLRKVALRVSDEIAATRRIAISAGQNIDDVCEAQFQEAISGLSEANQIALYANHATLIGSENTPLPVTSNTPNITPNMSDTLAALFGGVLLGLLAGYTIPRMFPVKGVKRSSATKLSPKLSPKLNTKVVAKVRR